MPRTLLAVLRHLLVLAAVAGGADLLDPERAWGAAPVAADGSDVLTSFAIAEQHWGEVPCEGGAKVAWVDDANTLLNATSTWDNPVDTWQQPALNAHCLVALNPEASWDWPKLCTVVAHEVGHLLGHQHAADPNDLMAAIYSVPLPECTAIAEPEGTLTQAAQQATAAQQAAAAAAAEAALSTHATDAEPTTAAAATQALDAVHAAAGQPTSAVQRASLRAQRRARCLSRARTSRHRTACHAAHAAHKAVHG